MSKALEKIEALNVEEQRVFVKLAARETFGDLFLLQLETGLRISEAVALQKDDIDIVNKRLYVTKAAKYDEVSNEKIIGTTKNKKSRSVPLSNEAIKLVSKHLATEGELLFTNSVGGLIDSNSLNRVLNRIYKKMQLVLKDKLQIKRLTTHVMRHTFATRMDEQGITLSIVSKWLGHSSVGVTVDVYCHLTEAKEEELDSTVKNMPSVIAQ